MAILEDLKKYNFNFSKKFGQNFIFDTNLLTSIVASANLGKDDEILEIGTGAGTLTNIIATHTKRVVSYEIDPALQEYLTDKFANTNNVELNFADIMKVSTETIDNKFPNGYHIIANLPYYITTPIIFKFLEESKNLKSMTIMVQQEVADRLVAKANTENYGAITASIDTIGTAKIIKKINRRMFTPAPNVDSAIVQIIIEPNKYDIDDIDTLKKLIKSAFAMRRKTLSNNLKQHFNITNEQINQYLTELNKPLTIRGEALSTEDLVKLANILHKNNIK